jgi:hypothetical protein
MRLHLHSTARKVVGSSPATATYLRLQPPPQIGPEHHATLHAQRPRSPRLLPLVALRSPTDAQAHAVVVHLDDVKRLANLGPYLAGLWRLSLCEPTGAMRAGSVGNGWATATLLNQSLMAMRNLIDPSLA